MVNLSSWLIDMDKQIEINLLLIASSQHLSVNIVVIKISFKTVILNAFVHHLTSLIVHKQPKWLDLNCSL